MTNSKLKSKLESLYKDFNASQYLQTDPIGIVHQYPQAGDRELVAYIVSMMAYGSAPLIRKHSQEILSPLGDSPTEYLRSHTFKQIQKSCRFEYYRFYKRKDILRLLESLQRLIKKYGRLEECFQATRTKGLTAQFGDFQNQIKSQTKASDTYGWRYLFPNPQTGVAKRAHMFLRWMVRKDDIDFGLWKSIEPKDLFLPLDTHLFDLSKRLKLTKRKTLDRKTLIECTESLRKINPIDPIRYDFALCRLGILKIKDEHL